MQDPLLWRAGRGTGSEEEDSETMQLCRSLKPGRRLAAVQRSSRMEGNRFQDGEPGAHLEVVQGRW